MKKVLLSICIVVSVVACQKSVVPIPVLNPQNTDSLPAGADTVTTPVDTLPQVDTVTSFIATPFLQRMTVQRDRTHADSAFLQLPYNYYAANNTETYPLLVFLNGMYEGSNYGPLNKLLPLGPPKYMADSLRFTFTVNNKKERVIVVCPQSENGFRKATSTNQVIDYILANYRIDTKRIYLTGLSAGAHSVFTYLTAKPEYAARIAAVVPMSTTYLTPTAKANLHYINDATVHTLVYCGTKDSSYFNSNKRYVKWINDVTPGLAEFVPYIGSHKGWNKMYSPTHRYYNPNIYEWMLKFSK